jgi:TrmH family RNA methyltransferase
VVTSHANPLLKQVRALARRKTRRETGWFLAEGLKLVSDAIDAGWVVKVLVQVADDDDPRLGSVRAATRRAGGDVVAVPPAVMRSLANRDNPRSVLGVFEQRAEHWTTVDVSPGDLWVGLDRVRDPGNLGTIIRTVDAVGATGVVLLGDCTDPFGVDAVRATMGSIFDVRISTASAEEFIAWRPGFGGSVVGTHLAATTDYRTLDDRRPAVLLMGNEQGGLPDQLAAVCDQLVRIPMAGRADSLNLAVATGVMLFEMSRTRLG